MLSNLLITFLSALGVLILGGIFVMVAIFILTAIRLFWASTTKAINEFKNSKE